jgi:transketolase
MLESVEPPQTVASDVPVQRMVPAYTKALLAQAESNPRIVALDADLVLDTGLIPFRDAFPERFIECGIAEQDMVSQAGGLALQGFLPIAHSFACFLGARANEQIFTNATERSKVLYVGSLAGLLPAGPGHSHQSVRDISALAGMPGMLLAEPCCEEEVAPLLDHLLNRHTGPGYLRLVSIPCAIPYQLSAGHAASPGRGVTLRDGKDAVVIGYGPVLLPQAWHALDEIEKAHGRKLKLVNLPWLNCVDRDWLAATVGDASMVFALDNHFIKGGQGEAIGAAIASLPGGTRPRLVQIGVEDIPVCGANVEVLAHHGLDAASLAAAFTHHLS